MPSLSSSPWIRGAPHSGLAMLISWISLRMSGGYSWSATTTSRLPVPIRSETRAMPTDDCIRLDDRQRIACFGKQSIKTNEYQPIKNTKGLPPRRGSPQDVDLLPKHPDLCLQCCSRSHQVNERPENQPAKVRHYAVASADSSLLANWIKFTIGTGDELVAGCAREQRPTSWSSCGLFECLCTRPKRL